MKILISAGEASGEMYGAQLIEALRRPDLAIVIDSPAFNWRVARQMHRRGIPVVYYVCPQFWAWRQGRVRLLRKYIAKALVIFPFEEKFYRDRGVDAMFVGHPLAEIPLPLMNHDEYARQHNLDPGKPWITLMPGSRVKEVRMNLPTILESAAKLGWGYEFLLPVAPMLGRTWLQSAVQHGRPRSGSGPLPRLVPEALPALAHSRAGIIASGTATIEAALMGTPFVMVYRVSPLTYLLGKPRIKVSHFAMVNLIAGEEVVPELVQQNFTADKVVARLNEILPYGPARDKMIAGLAEVKARLGGGKRGSLQPAEKAAEVVLGLLHGSPVRAL